MSLFKSLLPKSDSFRLLISEKVYVSSSDCPYSYMASLGISISSDQKQQCGSRSVEIAEIGRRSLLVGYTNYNITKKEWVLDGDTVLYGGASELRATLEYDLTIEKAFSYKGMSMPEIIAHIARFISRLW